MFGKSIVSDPFTDDLNNIHTESPVRSVGRVDLLSHSCQVSRLLQQPLDGNRERIELLGRLLVTTKLDPVPDTYDETDQIVKAIDRNEQFQHGPDGQRLSKLAHAARSNLNKDIDEFCQEIQRQFGLYAVEVTGDGVRDDRSSSSDTVHRLGMCFSRHTHFGYTPFVRT